MKLKANGTIVYSGNIIKIPVIDETGREFRIMTRNYKFYNDYEQFGFASKVDFILAHRENELDSDILEAIEKLERIEKRNAGYKEKLYIDELKALAKELKFTNPELSHSERMDMAEDIVKSRTGSKIKWKYLKEVNEKKLKSIRYQKLNKDILKSVLPINREYNTLKEFYREVRTSFDWSVMGLRHNEWSSCAVLNGNLAVIGNHNRILSYNVYSKEGFIFDIIDVLTLLFDMTISDMLNFLNINVKEFAMYTAEQRHYKTILRSIDIIEDIPNINRLGVIDVYRVLLSKGLEKMNTKNFINDKNVFFFSITAILEVLGIEKSQSNISKIGSKINILASLGLIQKVFRKDLPESLIFENGKGYDNNYFIIPSLDFDAIKQSASTLKENKVGTHNISFKLIGQIFSIEFAKSIFNQLKEKAQKTVKAIKSISKELYIRLVEYATNFNGEVDKPYLNILIEEFQTLEEFEAYLQEDDDIANFFN